MNDWLWRIVCYSTDLRKLPIVWLKETNAKDTDNLLHSQSRQLHLKAQSMSYIRTMY